MILCKSSPSSRLGWPIAQPWSWMVAAGPSIMDAQSCSSNHAARFRSHPLLLCQTEKECR
eukprot:2184130-Pleurochrysis_carterae.AAC.1